MPINLLVVSVTGCAHTYYLSRVNFMHGGGHYRTKNSVYWHQNASIPADYVQYNSHNIIITTSDREDKADFFYINFLNYSPPTQELAVKKVE